MFAHVFQIHSSFQCDLIQKIKVTCNLVFYNKETLIIMGIDKDKSNLKNV